MQVFLPSANFQECAKILDSKRLNKQLVECQQIFNTIFLIKKSWKNHPAVKMFEQHPLYLYGYALAIYLEYKRRFKKESHQSFIKIVALLLSRKVGFKAIDLAQWQNRGTSPFWLGNNSFHASHRSALLYKKPDWYSQFGWIEKPEINYIWPTKHLTNLQNGIII